MLKAKKRTLPLLMVLMMGVTMMLLNAGAVYADDTTGDVVIQDNFHDFFDENGVIKEITGGELIFRGDFSGLDVQTITIGKSVTLSSERAVFKDVGFLITADGVTMDGFTIEDAESETAGRSAAIQIDHAKNVILSNNTITFAKTDGRDGYCIYAENADSLTLENNTLIYNGDTDGNNRNMVMAVKGTESEPVTDITVTGNTIEAAVPSVDVSYNSNGNAVRLSCGLEFDNCDAYICHNKVTITSAGTAGYYPSVYGLICTADQSVSASAPQFHIEDNTICITGVGYVCGMTMSAAAYSCSNNKFEVESDYYAAAVQADGPSVTESFDSNTFMVSSASDAYGLYFADPMGTDHGDVQISHNGFELDAPLCICILKDSWTNSESSRYTINNNRMSAKGDILCGVSLINTDTSSVIAENEIYTDGTNEYNGGGGYVDENLKHYSCGIITSGVEITDNTIISSGPGVATRGTSSLTGNRIETTYEYTIDLNDSASNVTGNYLKAVQRMGNASVYRADNAQVYDNYPTDISGATVTGIADKTYTGREIVQTPVVQIGNTTLENDTDYTVSYKNNTNVGTATVTITGRGNHAGTIEKTFKINAASISGATVTGIADKTYTGKEIVQTPVVQIGGTTLKNDTDYTVSYKNNTNVGTATVTITGKGNHIGSIIKTFAINKAANPLSIKAKTATVKYSKVKKKAQTLAVSKVIKTGKKGQGTVTYTKASGNKKITINKKTGKVTVKKGLKKGTYKVKVKVKAAGNANYKAVTKAVKFKVKVK